jgi:hypothetical protein
MPPGGGEDERSRSSTNEHAYTNRTQPKATVCIVGFIEETFIKHKASRDEVSGSDRIPGAHLVGTFLPEGNNPMKRFTDTEIWEKEWFMKLDTKRKCLVRFLFDRCDAAGVWSVNWTLASHYVGDDVDAQDLKGLEKHFRFLNDGKVWVIDFIQFQYGKLSAECKPHQKVIALLEKHKIKGYTYPTDRVQEKEEEEDKEEERIKQKVVVLQEIFGNEIFIGPIRQRYPDKNLKVEFETCYDYHIHGKSPPGDVNTWKQKFISWLASPLNHKQPSKNNQYQQGKFVA